MSFEIGDVDVHGKRHRNVARCSRYHLFMPHSERLPHVYVLHSGEASDRALAETLASRLAEMKPTFELMTTAELVTRYRSVEGRNRLIAEPARVLHGTMIVLLSQAIIDDADTRRALVAAAGTGAAYFRRYFIVRGPTPDELRVRYPDLAPIYENLTLHTEHELPAILQDIQRTQGHPNPWRGGLVLTAGTAAGMIGTFLGRIYELRFVIAAALGLVLFMRWSERWAVTLAAGCFYIIGLGLSRIDPLDLWPWLGRCWKYPASAAHDLGRPLELLPLGPLTFAGAFVGAAMLVNSDRRAGQICLVSGVVLQVIIDNGFFLMAHRRLRQPRPELPLDTNACDIDHLQRAYRSALTLRHFNVVYAVGSLLLVGFPAAIAAARFASHAGLYLAAFAVGTVLPTYSGMAWLAATRQVMRFRGMTTAYLALAGKTFSGSRRGAARYPLGIEESLLSSFAKEERAELERFVFLQRLAPGPMLRRWSGTSDFAFISYAWSDTMSNDTARRVDDTLQAIGVESFRDKRTIIDPYAAWREHIAAALMRCTHFFLIVSPGIRNAQVVWREIETAIERRHVELLPAVICISDPEIEQSLREDARVPLQIRFLLTCCPQMTAAEAMEPRQLRYIIELTRREGRRRDWMAILSAAAARYEIFRMPSTT